MRKLDYGQRLLVRNCAQQRINDLGNGWLECKDCGSRWSPIGGAGGQYPRYWWACPIGCNRKSSFSIDELELGHQLDRGCRQCGASRWDMAVPVPACTRRGSPSPRNDHLGEGWRGKRSTTTGDWR